MDSWQYHRNRDSHCNNLTRSCQSWSSLYGTRYCNKYSLYCAYTGCRWWKIWCRIRWWSKYYKVYWKLLVCRITRKSWFRCWLCIQVYRCRCIMGRYFNHFSNSCRWWGPFTDVPNRRGRYFVCVSWYECKWFEISSIWWGIRCMD